MSFRPLPDITLIGSTPGAVTGESVELLPHWPTVGLFDGFSMTIEVRVIATGLISGTRYLQSFVQRFAVSRSAGGVTSIAASDTQQKFGDSAASSWTLTAAVGAGPDRFQLTFTTGSTQAATNVVADLFITKMLAPTIPLPPSGPIQFLRGDSGVTQLGGVVSAWLDQTSFHTDMSQSTPAARPTFVASDPLFNNQPVVGGGGPGVTSLIATGLSLSIPSGATFAVVFRNAAGNGDGVLGINAGNAYVGSDSPNARPQSGSGLLAGLYDSSGTLVKTNPGIVLITTAPGFSGWSLYLYANGSTLRMGSSTNGSSLDPITQLLMAQLQSPQWVAEQQIWPRVLTSTEITQYMAYASFRYGIPLH